VMAMLPESLATPLERTIFDASLDRRSSNSTAAGHCRNGTTSEEQHHEQELQISKEPRYLRGAFDGRPARLARRTFPTPTPNAESWPVAPVPAST